MTEKFIKFCHIGTCNLFGTYLLKAPYQPPRSFFVCGKTEAKDCIRHDKNGRVYMDAVLSVYTFSGFYSEIRSDAHPTKSEAAQLPWTHGEMDRPALTASVVQQLPEPIIFLP